MYAPCWTGQACPSQTGQVPGLSDIATDLVIENESQLTVGSLLTESKHSSGYFVG